MKRVLLNLMLTAGAFTPFRLANRKKILVLMYHRVGDSQDEGTPSPHAFSEQLEHLARHYDVVPLSSVADLLLRGGPPPAGLAAITIDDGYRDAYETAFPLLRKHRLPATVFVVTGFTDGEAWLWTDRLRYAALHTPLRALEVQAGGRRFQRPLGDRASRLKAAAEINEVLKTLPEEEKERELRRLISSLRVKLPAQPPPAYAPITWEQAREMDAAGVEIGSHTVTHPILTAIGLERLRWELVESRRRLEEELRRRVDLFCYPNGNYNPGIQAEVAKAGYRCAVLTEPGLNDAGVSPLGLRRVPTAPDLAHFVQNTSGFEELKNRLRSGWSLGWRPVRIGRAPGL